MATAAATDHRYKTPDPQSTAEDSRYPDADEWKTAQNQELDKLH